MSAVRTQTHAVKQFACLGDQCPDTCCKGWGMQLTSDTIEKFRAQAPELLDAVTSGEAEFIMKRDPATDYCVKFDAGWCGIHRDYGAEFLGDACHFYPRVTRSLNEQVVTSIALSCPEAARIMLYGEDPFTLGPREELRVPFSLRNYLAEGLEPTAALELHELCVAEAGNPNYSAERNAMRLMMVARALEMQPAAQWLAAAKFYFTIADSRIPAAEAHAADPAHLAQALMGLVLASAATNKPGLMGIARGLQAPLGIRIDEATSALHLEADAPQRTLQLLAQWKQVEQAMRPVLTRYLQAQISQAMFPLAGLGASMSERLLIIAVRLATYKLALMVEAMHHGAAPTEQATVNTAYHLARFMDHLADPTLSLAIYGEVGWTRDARLAALLGA